MIYIYATKRADKEYDQMRGYWKHFTPDGFF